MIFIILIIIGLIGITATLWLSNARVRAVEFPVEPGHEWFAVPEDFFETSFVIAIKKRSRDILKKILIWMIAQYRKISREITIKQVVKKKVRAFLSDHDHTNVRAPSEFLKTMKRTRKSKSAKVHNEEDIQP